MKKQSESAITLSEDGEGPQLPCARHDDRIARKHVTVARKDWQGIKEEQLE